MRWKSLRKGFSLVELLVTLGIVGAFATITLIALNPVKQVNKGYDAERVKDLSTLATGLDTFYSDHNCYPASIPFGQKWTIGDTTYFQKVPNDPQASTNNDYVYLTENTSCPQWNVVFSKLANPQTSSSCTLPTNCLPQNYDASWACKVSGKLDCASLISLSLPTKITPTPSPGVNLLTQVVSQIQGFFTASKISICHLGDSGYGTLSVSENATVDGHDAHTADIIPPFDYTCSTGTCHYPGKNWTADNQAILNNNCTVTGNAIHFADGPYNQEGSLSPIQIPHQLVDTLYNTAMDLTGDFTIEAWIKPDVPPLNDWGRHSVYRIINGVGKLSMTMYQQDASHISYYYTFDVEDKNNGQCQRTAVWSDTFPSGTSPNNIVETFTDFNTWKHVAGVLYNHNLYIYVNGKLLASYVKSLQTIPCITHEDFVVGAQKEFNASFNSWTYLDYFGGAIDEVRMSNVARYTSNFTPSQTAFTPDANTMLLYHYNGDEKDASNNHLDGQLVGEDILKDVTFVSSIIH